MSPTPLALPPALPPELLTYILTHQTYPTSVIICQQRSTFLSSLLTSIPQTLQPQPPPPVEDFSDPQSSPNSDPPPLHPLLAPTLHQIATSRHIKLVFIPTLSHLRAYLSVFSSKEMVGNGPPEQKFDKPGEKTPLLVIYGLIELHRDTSEWSGQGLGNSIAGLVEAGWRTRRKVVLLEERDMDDVSRRAVGDVAIEERRKSKVKVWEERVPMLNGSVRRAGLDNEDSGWSGRTVEVGRILARWFDFGNGDSED